MPTRRGAGSARAWLSGLRPEVSVPKKRLAVLDQVGRTAKKLGMWRRGDKILVACSGGADSTALLHILLELREKHSLRLAVAHFNHRLRPAAAKDERFVIELAGKLGLPAYLRREDVRALAETQGLNVEEAGRQRRYAFLEKTAAKIAADRIATGHTMTDQAETVLLRLLRGTGPTGLTSIAPLLGGRVIRPLIEVERKEVEAYLRAKKIPHREDETNRDLLYLRNRVRSRLIPYLEKNFSPPIVRHLARLAEISREEEEDWEKAARSEAKKAVLRRGTFIALDAERLSSFSPALARRLVRFFLAEVRGDLRRISFEDVESVRRLEREKSVSLPGGLILRREDELILPAQTSRRPLSYQYVWDGRTDFEVKELGLRLAGKEMRMTPVLLKSLFPVKDLPGQEERRRSGVIFDDKTRAYLDVAKVRFPLVIRNRRDGDRYQPLGAAGRKKLKEIMRAKGIRSRERDKHPVFFSDGEIVWVLGLPVGERFKVTPRTKRILRLEMKRPLISSSPSPEGKRHSIFRSPRRPRESKSSLR